MSAAKDTTYISLPLVQLSAEKKFPGNLYLCIKHKMVHYKNKDDELSADEFNKLVYSHVKFVFIEEEDRKAYQQWITQNEKEENASGDLLLSSEDSEALPLVEVVQDQRRAMLDIFESLRDDKQVKAAIGLSKKMVMEFMKRPFALNNIQSIQRYSKGCLDHSVNVSVLSVFLGIRMGYTHQVILENLALGGLMHDIGKINLEKSEEALPDDEDPVMQEHPKVGREILEEQKEISSEVRMIVGQHHEFLDGSGYPNKLKGLAIYDLARVVAIANIYDNLVSESLEPSMKDRATEAIDRLETEYEGKLDPKKLEKAVKILRYTLL